MELLIAIIDKVASAIQAKGLLKEAEELDIIANTLEVEAAKKKKKKWIPKKLEEGRLSKYKKPGESMAEAAQRARKSDDPSVRGMGNLYLNVFHKKTAAELSEAERTDFIFPANNPKVKDKRGHFPIPDKTHGQNALARVNQYGSVPSWYDGSLEDLKKTVVDKVEAKFPKMEIEEEKFDK